MKKILIILIIISESINIYSQSIITNTESKSGILISPTNDFAGMSYETSTDKLSFNYKLITQVGNYKPKNNQDSLPSYCGINIGSDVSLEKSKGVFVEDEKWQGGVELNVTFTKAWDQAHIIDRIKTGNSVDGISHSGVDFQGSVLYLKISNALNRINTYTEIKGNGDTIFAKIYDPLQNSLTLTPGYYHIWQNESKSYLTLGVSTNISLINGSTRKLEETNLIPFSDKIFNLKDSTSILELGKSKIYFKGNPETELFIVPRFDIFYRFALGTDRPIIGIICSYSPIISSLKDVKLRHGFVIGTTFGLSTYPDQVVFALLNEIIQDKKGKFKYTFALQASLPFNIKEAD